jgi:hypothetical protein
MMQYKPFKTFVLACAMVLIAASTGLGFLFLRSDDPVRFLRSDDPVRDELQDIAVGCELPGADAGLLKSRLDMIVEEHGVDYIISENSRGGAFLRAGLGVQKLYRDGVEIDNLSTVGTQ